MARSDRGGTGDETTGLIRGTARLGDTSRGAPSLRAPLRRPSPGPRPRRLAATTALRQSAHGVPSVTRRTARTPSRLPSGMATSLRMPGSLGGTGAGRALPVPGLRRNPGANGPSRGSRTRASSAPRGTPQRPHGLRHEPLRGRADRARDWRGAVGERPLAWTRWLAVGADLGQQVVLIG